MYLDSLLLFSNAQAVTATAASTDTVDLGAVRDIGVGEEVYVVVVVTTALTDAGSDSTITVTLETDADSAFGSIVTAQTIGTFAALAAVGTRLVARLQPLAIVERYIRLMYTTANGNLSTGSFTAALTRNPNLYRNYANGYTISG